VDDWMTLAFLLYPHVVKMSDARTLELLQYNTATAIFELQIKFE